MRLPNLEYFLILFFGCWISCKPSTINDNSYSNVQVWWSSELFPESNIWFTDPPESSEIPYKLDRQPDLQFDNNKIRSAYLISIDPMQRFQSILGIGMALEGTTLYAMRKNRTPQQLTDIIRAFIDPEDGIGLNMFRLTIGLSDFSDGRSLSDHPKGFYTYQDSEDQPFSIQKDIEYGKIEMIKKVQDVAGQLTPPQELTFFASCWSPPAWMKTSGKLITGTLKPGYENQLASYFRNFVEAYEDLGIPIHAITIQNEPNYEPPAYPGMRLSPHQEASIVKATYRAFHESSDGELEIHTHLWINDHNFEDWKNAHQVLSILENEGKKHYVNAVAFHNYIPGDSVSHMSHLQNLHPAVDLQLTEHSEWGVKGMHNIQQYFQHGSRSYMYWVAMTTSDLDEHNQSPFNKLGELSPTLLIEKETSSPAYYATPEYYMIGQFSKFIRPGAVRIGCNSGSVDKVTAVGFENTDGSTVCVLVNQTDEEQDFQLMYRSRSVRSNLPPKTVGTYIW